MAIVAGKGCNWLGMAEDKNNFWKWLEMAVLAINGCKWL